MAQPTLTELGRGGGALVTTVTIPALNPGSAKGLVVVVSGRLGLVLPTCTVSGVAATFTQKAAVDDFQNVLVGWVFEGKGVMTTGDLTVTCGVSMEAIAVIVYKSDDCDATAPVNAIASAFNPDATDTNAPSVVVTPTVAECRILGAGHARNGTLLTPGAGYTSLVAGYSQGAGGSNVTAWSETKDVAPASGAATTVNGTLSAAREWMIFGIALAPGGGGTVVVAKRRVVYAIRAGVVRRVGVVYRIRASVLAKRRIVYALRTGVVRKVRVVYDLRAATVAKRRLRYAILGAAPAFTRTVEWARRRHARGQSTRAHGRRAR